ncbi:MAG: hypothetical protein VYA86_07045 [Candidatus Thermoplasmatota archaeon]|nr:hypothetical protein [Candidatus Thermoplasmatota archaeon]
MFRAKWWHLWVLSAVFFSTTVIAEDFVIDDPPQLTIDMEQGADVGGEVNLTGTYIDEFHPETITWKIYSGETIIDSGDLVENLNRLPVNQSTRDIWTFNIGLNFSSHDSCTCIIEIEASDVIQQSASARIIVFYRADSTNSLPPGIIFDQVEAGIRLSGVAEIPVVAVADGSVSSVQWSLTDNPDVAINCALSWIESPDLNWSNLSIIDMVDSALSLNTGDYEDGPYSLVIRASDGDVFSTAACLNIGIDNQLPSASIVGPTSLVEGTSMVQFDGSASADVTWGRAELMFLWVLEGGEQGPVVVSGTDLNTFEVDGGQSGNFTLTLTVVDQAGFTNSTTHQYSISNQAPVAAMRIGGQPLSDGDQITLTDSNQWLIECGDSTDTSNDQGRLACTWSIDGVPTMTGWTRELQKPDDLAQPHTLTLEVTDDNGASDTITVEFGVQGTPSDPSYNDGDESEKPLRSLIFVIAGCALVLSLYLGFRYWYSGHSSPIPKWKRE